MVVVDTPPGPRGTPFWLHDATITVRALDLLEDLAVFDGLAEGPATTQELADRLGLARRPLELALDVAAHHTGVVRFVADGAHWVMAEPSPLATTLRADDLRAVVSGGPPVRDVARSEESAAVYGPLVERIGRVAHAVSPQIIPCLRSPSGQRVLELAAGASPWGLALCSADPACRVTAIDLPPVIETTRAVVAEAGLTDRFDFLAGDVFTISDPEPADLVIVAGFCRLLGPEQNAAVFERAATWCRPGGRVAVIDAVATPDARAAGLSGYELGLLTRTAAGRCWSLDDYAEWLTAAGFAHLDVTATDRPEMTLVTATRTDAP